MPSMILVRSILFALLVVASFGQQCSPKFPYTEVVHQSNEQVHWQLRDFFAGENLEYSVDQNAEFTLNQPITQVGTAQPHIDIMQDVVTVKALTFPLSGAWLNSFAALDQQSNAAYVLWASASLKNIGKIPQFANRDSVYQGNNQALCFDLIWTADDTVIVDCGETGGATFQNTWYQTKMGDGSVSRNNSYLYGSSVPTERILRSYTILNAELGSQTQYIFRAVPYYGIDREYIGQSVVEVFSIDADGFPISTTSYLDTATLRVLTGIANFNFTLVDLQVHGDGQVYILDQVNGVLILTYTADGLWHLVSVIASNSQVGLALSVNDFVNAAGTYGVNIGVLYVQSFDITTLIGGARTVATYRLPTSQGRVSVAQFTISQGYVIIQDSVTQELYLYSTDQKKVLYTLAGFPATAYALLNPYSTSLGVVALTQSTSHKLSNGLLIFSSTPTEVALKAINVVATSKVGNVSLNCSVVLNYQVLNSSSSQIIVYDTDKIQSEVPQAIIYPSKVQFSLDNVASGAGLTYTVQKQSNNNESKFLQATEMSAAREPTEIFQYLQMSLNAPGYPSANSVLASFVLALDDPNIFLEIVQVQINATTSQIQVWQCETTTLQVNATCAPFKNGAALAAPIPLSAQSLYAYAEFDQFHLAYLISNYSIAVWTCDDEDGCVPAKIFTYPTIAGQEITAISIVGPYVYVLFAAQNFVDVWSLFDNFDQVAHLDQAAMSVYGVTQFTPKKLFSNRVTKPNFIFIDNGDSLIIGAYSTSFGVESIISYLTIGSTNVDVSVGANSLFLVLANAQVQMVYLYNYQDITNVYFQGAVDLYELYTIPFPIVAGSAQLSGFYFLRVQDATTKANIILVFKPDVLLRQSIYVVLPTPTLDQGGLISVSGGANMFIYFKFGTIQQTWQVLSSAQLFFDATDDSVNNESLEYGFTLASGVTNEKRPVPKSVTIFDTKLVISIDQSAFVKEADNALKINKNKEQMWPLRDNWYKGQVLNFTINCTECGTKIFIENKVQQAAALTANLLGVTDFDGVPGTTHRYAQTADTIYIINSEDELVGPIIKLQLPTATMKCLLITAQQAGDYIVSICVDDGQYFAYVTSTLSDYTPLGAFLLTEVQSTYKVQLVGDSLIVLNSAQQPLTSISNLLIYNLDNEEFTFELATTIDTDYLSSVQTVYFSDFFVQTITQQNYNNSRLYLLDASNSFFAIEGTINALGFYAPQLSTSANRFQIRNFLNGASQVVGKDTIFYRIAPVGTYTYENATNTLTQQVIVTTSNVAHYLMNFVYDYSVPSRGAVAKAASIDKIINRYGSWVALNRLKVSRDLVVIPYANGSLVVLAVYNLNQAVNMLGATTPVISMQGGQQIQTSPQNQSNLFVYFVQKADNSTQLQSNSPDNANAQLQAYNINPQVSLLITNGTSIQKQTITVSAQNDFSNATVDYEISQRGDEDSAFKWYYILLIVLGAVLVLGGVAFFCCRTKKDQVEGRLLDNQ